MDADFSWLARVPAQETGELGFTFPQFHPAFGLLAVLFFVLLNGFFSAAEFAFVAIRRSRVEQLVAERRPGALAVKQAVDRLDAYVAACQLGITMASLALGWIGEPLVASLIEPLFAAILPADWAFISAHTVAIIIAFAFITVLHITLGEFAPKGLGLQRAEATSLVTAVPMSIFLRIFSPLIFVLNGLGNLVLRVLGLRTGVVEEAAHSPDEVRYVVRSVREAGLRFIS